MIELEEFQKAVLETLAELIAFQIRLFCKLPLLTLSADEAREIMDEVRQFDKRHDKLQDMLMSFGKERLQ